VVHQLLQQKQHLLHSLYKGHQLLLLQQQMMVVSLPPPAAALTGSQLQQLHLLACFCWQQLRAVTAACAGPAGTAPAAICTPASATATQSKSSISAA
jgi:hypothetical protein